MDGTQLRNSILQWAIEGHLVPQCPTDEPATELLQRIQAAHIYRDDNGQWQEKAGDKVTCIDDEIPFQLPKGWAWVRLGEIVSFRNAVSVKSEDIDKSTWLLDLEDIEKHTGRLICKKRMGDAKAKSDKHAFVCGNVLYCKLRPYLNKVIIADEDGVCTSEILAFDFGLIDSSYAQLYLMSPYFVSYAMRGSYGVKMPRLSSSHGSKALFPLPPLPEQRRIVSRLSLLLPLVERYGRSQSALDALNAGLGARLRRSLLQEAVMGRLVATRPEDGTAAQLLDDIRREKQQRVKEGTLPKSAIQDSHIYRDTQGQWQEKIGKNVTCINEQIPFELPEGWEWVRIKQIAVSNLGKTLDRGKDVGDYKDYLCAVNVQWGKIEATTTKQFRIEEKDKERYAVKYGDLLLCEGGEVGRGAIWREHREMYYQNALHRVRFYAGISAQFFLYVFMYYKDNGTIDRISKGMTIKHFTQNVMNGMLFPLPPLSVQRRIVSRLSSLFSVCP